MKKSSSIAFIGIATVTLMAIALASFIYWHQLGKSNSKKLPTPGFLPVVHVGGPFTLMDHNKRQITEKSFPGKFLLITFGYTHCPDICPSGLSNISNALKKLGKTAKLIQPLFITVDPERDTPKVLASYVDHFHPSLRGLTGQKTQIESVARAFRIFSHTVTQDDASEYLLNHTTFIYLMAPNGKLARIFRHQTAADDLAMAISAELYKDK